MDFTHLDALALAELVRKREVTAKELVDLSIAQIEARNPEINAVTSTLFERARTEADQPHAEGPFKGVPFLLKDLFATLAGTPTTSGCRALAHAPARLDSALVTRFKEAGFVIVGKTNTAEFGLVPTTEPKFFGPTKNPWDLERTAGGSSGGSAAAVASGMVPLAHANDGGGSIRIPAACCGVFGLKPSRGRNPIGPHAVETRTSLLVEHVITRSVRDSAAVLDLTAHSSPVPWGPPPPPQPFSHALEANPRSLRIAFSRHLDSARTIDPSAETALTETVQLLEALGHQVTEEAPALDVAATQAAFAKIWVAQAAENRRRVIQLSRPQNETLNFDPMTQCLANAGERMTENDLEHADRELEKSTQVIATFFKNYDLWLTPVWTTQPPKLGFFDAYIDSARAILDRCADLIPFAAIANFTGQPAMSVPLFRDPQNLPQGSHFLGRFGEESTLLSLAAQLERAQPWIHR